jgi:hypothetical protein
MDTAAGDFSAWSRPLPPAGAGGAAASAGGLEDDLEKDSFNQFDFPSTCLICVVLF